MSASHYHWRGDTLVIRCHIQPGAAHTAFAGLFNERLKIRVRATATDGAANKCLIKYLATEFNVAKSQVELVKGLTSRHKTVAINSPKAIPRQTDITRV